MIVTVSAVRDYLSLNASNSKYDNDTIGSNIRAAQSFLERRTGRVLEDTSATKTFTTEGKTSLEIPGLRTASSVELSGSALVADSTYWLLPDAQRSGLYTGIQFRAYRTNLDASRPWWYGHPEWFDRGLDLPGGFEQRGSLPNDLVIAGSWGWTPDQMPAEAIHATKVLAAYFTKRPDAILSGGVSTPDGATFDLTSLPVEVQAFISEWRLAGGGAEAVG